MVQRGLRQPCDVMWGRSFGGCLPQSAVEMARVKNVVREDEGEGVALPRAVFPNPLKKQKKKLTRCSDCGLLLRKSNLSRHMKTKHAVLLVKLPVVSKPLGDMAKGSSDETEEAEEADEAEEAEEAGKPCLPTTPQSEEELNRELAKLYASRVPKEPYSMPYTLTRTLVSLAKEESGREELRHVLQGVGLYLYTQEEKDQMLRDAEDVGRSQKGVGIPEDASVLSCLPPQAEESISRLGDLPEVRGTASSPESSKTGTSVQDCAPVPPVTVTSVFREGKPQTVTVHLGGSWGLELHPVQLQ